MPPGGCPVCTLACWSPKATFCFNVERKHQFSCSNWNRKLRWPVRTGLGDQLMLKWQLPTGAAITVHDSKAPDWHNVTAMSHQEVRTLQSPVQWCISPASVSHPKKCEGSKEYSWLPGSYSSVMDWSARPPAVEAFYSPSKTHRIIES